MNAPQNSKKHANYTMAISLKNILVDYFVAVGKRPNELVRTFRDYRLHWTLANIDALEHAVTAADCIAYLVVQPAVQSVPVSWLSQISAPAVFATALYKSSELLDDYTDLVFLFQTLAARPNAVDLVRVFATSRRVFEGQRVILAHYCITRHHPRLFAEFLNTCTDATITGNHLLTLAVKCPEIVAMLLGGGKRHLISQADYMAAAEKVSKLPNPDPSVLNTVLVAPWITADMLDTAVKNSNLVVCAHLARRCSAKTVAMTLLNAVARNQTAVACCLIRHCGAGVLPDNVFVLLAVKTAAFNRNTRLVEAFLGRFAFPETVVAEITELGG